DRWRGLWSAAAAPRGACGAGPDPRTARRRGGRAHQSGVRLKRTMAWTWFHRLASPPHIYRVAGRLTPWLAWPAAALIVAGLIGGLVLAPPDYQQGDGYRILYV